jgi:hypothetical protein
MRSPSCVSVIPINFRVPKPIFITLSMYIMEGEPILTAYFLSCFHQSVSTCVFFPSLQDNGSITSILRFGATQRDGKHVPAAMNTYNNGIIVGRFTFYAVCVLSKECLWVYVSPYRY